MTQLNSFSGHELREPFQTTLMRMASERLDAFIGTIRPDGSYASRVYLSLKSITEEIQHDYGRRFLIELIQNGYDAHEASERTGEIAIRLCVEEGENGVLYVADKGAGFTQQNVEALCDVGLSDKPIGQAIGNKGLGFRSVTSISDDPQVFSRLPGSHSSRFDGFCFRFAGSSDFDRLLDSDIHRTLAKKDLPKYHVPTPIQVPPDNELLCNLAETGFATVIRLPLRNKFALEAVIEAVSELHVSKVPVLLFLPKLSRLSVVVEGGNGSMDFILSRVPQSSAEEDARTGNRFELVDLDEFGRFFVAWRSVPEAAVRIAIQRSVEQRELHESWEDWLGDGEVAVAVPIDEQDVVPRLFTYLPMGPDAEAPFRGFLHGSFYPKADRTSMRAEIPLNELLLEEAVKLCATTIHHLRSSGWPPTVRERGTVVGGLIVDLMSWRQARGISGSINDHFPELMLEAFKELGIELQNTALLPRISSTRWPDWASPLEVGRWDKHADLDVLGMGPLTKVAGIAALPPSLGKERTDRLEVFLREAGIRMNLTPGNEEIAGAVELIARDLHARNAPPLRWTAFYQDLAEVWDSTDSQQWSGRSILLCNDGRLRASTPPDDPGPSTRGRSPGSRRRRRRAAGAIAVFFPPVRRPDDSEDEEGQVRKVPRALGRWFALLDERLDWPGALEPTRSALETAGLVRRYDSEELVTHISGVLARNKTVSVRREALQWVFGLWRVSGSNLLRRARLYMPTVKGRWIPSDEATFSRGWPQATLGDITHSLISRARHESEDLRRIERSLIASPRSRPFSRGPLYSWVEFLELLKVQKGLRVLPLDPAPVEMRGSEISLRSICARLKLGSRTHDHMRLEMNNREPEIKYGGTRHKLKGVVSYFPGQEEFADLDEESRELYACLVIECLPRMRETNLRMEVVSESFPWVGRTTWPSPALSFLTQESWFPVENRGLSAEPEFLRPREILLERDTGEPLPPFVPRPSRNARECLSHGATREALVEVAGAWYFDEPDSLTKQVQILIATFKSGFVQPSQQTTFENVYWETWRRIVNSQPALEWEWEDDARPLLVRSRGALVDISLSELARERDEGEAQSRTVYVRDDDSGLAARLLEDLGYFVLDVGGQRAHRTGEFFEGLLGNLCRRTSQVETHVVVDGHGWREHDTLESVVGIFPALPQIVSLCMASLVGPAAQRLPRDWGKVLDVLQRIRLTSGTKIELSIEGRVLGLPAGFFGSLAIEDPDAPAIILESEEAEIGWLQLKRASRSLARLLGHSDLDKALALAFSSLDQKGARPAESVSSLPYDELYRTLGLDAAAVRRATNAYGSSLERAAAFLGPLVHYFAGSVGVEQFNRSVTTASTTLELAAQASQLISDDALDEERILSLLQSVRTLVDVMEELQLDFARFNSSLEELGIEPITYPDRHLHAVRAFISENYDDVMDRLRAPYLTTFQAFGTLETYVAARSSLANLEPKPEWLAAVREPDRDMLDTLIHEWVESALPSQKVVGRVEMPSYTDVHRKNARVAKETIKNAAPLIKAWCIKSGILPGDWDESNGLERLTDRLNDSGALDFLLLQSGDVVRWLHELGVWPEAMPLSVSANDLGLTEEDINWERQREKEAREIREHERRSIFLNGQLIDPQQMSPPALADELEKLLNTDVLRTPLGILRPIVAPRSNRKSPGDRKPPAGPKSPTPRLNSEKAELVGFLGELAVYQWLKRRLPRQNIDAAWVSSNRSKLLPGSGDDSLGYDFEVYYQRRRVLLEVKAHLGDPQWFELGETEVVRAQDCNRRSGCDYYVVYVSNVADTPSLNIEILPNPLSDQGENAYRLDGQGLRYRFSRPS